MHLSSQDERRLKLSYFWLTNEGLRVLVSFVCVFAPVLALITSLVQHGLYVFLALGEIVLGAVLSRIFIPLAWMNLLLFLTIPTLITIFGALWGFWFI